MRKFLLLASCLLCTGLFAENLTVLENPKPPVMVVDKEHKKVVTKGKRRPKKLGWGFVAGAFAFYGAKNPGDKEDELLGFPFFSVGYKQKSWEIGMKGLGVEAKYLFLDEAIESSLGLVAGWKRDSEKSTSGYKTSVINDLKAKVGVAAYFFRVDYFYAPVKIVHPLKNNEDIDAHFWEFSLESPGFPIMVKPRFWGIKAKVMLSVMDDNFARAYLDYYDQDGKTTYSAEGGLHSFSYSFSSNLMINKKWMLILGFNREYYLGDAKNSPAIEKTTTNKLTSMLMYRF